MEIVKTINLKKYYKMDNYTVKAVDNINLNINNHDLLQLLEVLVVENLLF